MSKMLLSSSKFFGWNLSQVPPLIFIGYPDIAPFLPPPLCEPSQSTSVPSPSLLPNPAFNSYKQAAHTHTSITHNKPLISYPYTYMHIPTGSQMTSCFSLALWRGFTSSPSCRQEKGAHTDRGIMNAQPPPTTVPLPTWPLSPLQAAMTSSLKLHLHRAIPPPSDAPPRRLVICRSGMAFAPSFTFFFRFYVKSSSFLFRWSDL